MEYINTCGKINGRRFRGRTSKMFVHQPKGTLNVEKVGLDSIFELARDQRKWKNGRFMADKGWSRSGTW